MLIIKLNKINSKWFWLTVLGIVAFAAGVWMATLPIERFPINQFNLPEKNLVANIVAVEPGFLTIDEVAWFSGEAAQEAMRQDGACQDQECYPPNDFYIRNSSPASVRYRVPPTVEVKMQTWSHDETGNYNWNQNIPYAEYITRLSDYNKVPFKLTLRGEFITRIVEQYVP